MEAVLLTTNKNGIILQLGKGISCRIDVCSTHIFRVLIIPEKNLRQTRTWTFPSTAKDAMWKGSDKLHLNWTGTNFTVSEGENLISLKTTELILNITKSPFGLSWCTKNGVVFASDRASRPYVLKKKSQGVQHFMRRGSEDMFFGLGDKTGPLNLGGRRLRTAMTDALGYNPKTGDPLYKHWPFLIVRAESSAISYGTLYDNMSSATFDLGCEHSNYYGLFRTYEAEGGDLDMYMILGPQVADVVKRQMDLTGNVPFSPRWTLGYHCTAMSLADAPNAQEEIATFLEKCLEHEIPCSAFHFGSGYTSIDKRRYVFTWNKTKFPDPAKLIEKFQKAGQRVVANVKPCLLTDHPRYAEVAAFGGFINSSVTGQPCISQFWDGEGSHLDFTNPTTILWWQQNILNELLSYGISSVWNDNNEYELWDEDAYSHGFGEAMDLQLLRPLHSLLMTRASLEAQTAKSPSLRQYSVSRAGCFGISRMAQTWSGDNSTSWENLKWNLRTGLQMSLSGMFDIGHDVGGFAGPPPSPELLVRWTQAGLLHPRFLMNSWKADGTVTTPFMHAAFTPLVRWAIRLRYRLVPYLYSCSWAAAQKSVPIVRPTFFDFGADPKCWEENDDVMVGPILLAAPVVQLGARQRQVYLPCGPPGWYDFYTEEYFEAGQLVTVRAPLDRVPLFVVAGSVLLLTAEASDFSRLHDEPSRILRVFPAMGSHGPTCIQFCEDDGIRAFDDAEKGSYNILEIELESSSDEVHVRVRSLQGTYLPYDNLQVAIPLAESRALISAVEPGNDDLSLKLKILKGQFKLHAL